MSEFWPFQSLKTLIFDIEGNFDGPIRSAHGESFQCFIGIFQKISKVSKKIFCAFYDHVVAQKSIFWIKFSKKVVIEKFLPWDLPMGP